MPNKTAIDLFREALEHVETAAELLNEVTDMGPETRSWITSILSRP